MSIIIGLTGIDGSGKTTVARLLAGELEKKNKRVTYHHELNFVILVPLFRFFRRLVGSHEAESFKRYFLVGSNQSQRFLATAYYFMVWLDNLVSFTYFKLKRGIVIHDRWPYDIPAIFEYRRYNNKFIESLLLNFPRPDVLILLKIPAEVALARKKDDLWEWHQTLDFYQSIERRVENISKKHKYEAIIDATKTPDQISSKILQILAIKENLSFGAHEDK